MKRLPIFLLLGAFAVASLNIGCRDETDPEYWLNQMYDRPWREKSLKTLNEIFNRAMQDNNSDLNHPVVKELIDLMVPELMEGFKTFTRDKFNRTEIIKLLAQMKDERTIPIFMEGLNLDETSESLMFTTSASAIQRQGYEGALPKLLEAHKAIIAARDRRPGAPFTNSENEIEQAVISATSSIVAKHPSTSHKGAVVKMLCDIAETSDELQELRLNMKALKGLGKIGDSTAIPTLIKGIAMKGKRQPIGLGQIAFAGLLQLHNRDAVVDAILRFANRKDPIFNEYYKEEMKLDPVMQNPTWYIQQATTFLGMLNYASPKVIQFLNKELNHTEPDSVDTKASRLELKVNFDPSGWATVRRNWAAVALAEIGHKPVLQTIKSRMGSSKKGGRLQAEEAVGYVRALGILLYPDESCDLLLATSKTSDDSLRDKVFYNASLMCDAKFLRTMQKAHDKIDCDGIVAERFPDGASPEDEKQTINECNIMKKRIVGYMDRIKYGKKCGKDVACHQKTVEAKASPDKERAIYTLYQIGRDTPAKRKEVIKILTANLDNPSKAAMKASVFALDHLTPKGDKALVKRIQEVYRQIKSSYKGRARMLESFIGRVRNRGR